MALPPTTIQSGGTVYTLWWRVAGGTGSFPLHSVNVTAEALRTSPRFGVPKLSVDGDDHTLWQDWFFKQPVSDTNNRGSFPLSKPLASAWTAAEVLRKPALWASRDYSLRVVMNDWFFGASSTFGRSVGRARPLCDSVADVGGVVGWGGFPLRFRLTTREALTPNHAWGNDDTTLQTKMLDWFLGRTTGSADMHILYTYDSYSASGGLSPRVLLKDDFDDLNNTNLSGKPLDVGGSWTVCSGSWDVQGGKAGITGSPPGQPQWVATAGATRPDGVLSVTVRDPRDDSGLVARYNGQDDGFWLLSVADGADTFTLYERSGGAWTVRATTGLTVDTTTDYNLRLTLDGTTLTGTVNQGNQISYGSATFNQSETVHGLRADSSSGTPGPTFNDFLMVPLIR